MTRASEKPVAAPEMEPPATPAEPPPVPASPPEPPAPPLDLRELTGRRLELVDRPHFPFELAKSKPPEPGSLYAWGIAKGAPAWLIKAMAVGQPVNKMWSEAEFDELAQKTARLTLGRKGA